MECNRIQSTALDTGTIAAVFSKNEISKLRYSNEEDLQLILKQVGLGAYNEASVR